ncbi:serine/threonine protein kinase [Rhizobium indicum]|uniref:Serine/threonine protein kinase n=1 Tax=Rhizobium indicum TaxID=2583231 RepID=A0ABX6P9C0_9HYPH|nr:serine/threonine-protein kinase [Rhizobium indicum]QKK15622.1 serine/threonine protein kinase [Rhizobium indicum]
MPIDYSKFPAEIVPTIRSLEKDIDFERASEKGANGYVLFGQNRLLERSVVIKFYFWENGDHIEPKRLAQLEHDHVVKIYDAQSIDDDYAFYMMRHCDGGDIDNHLFAGKIGLIKATDLTTQVASAVSFLHAEGFLHRDLKPENIFLDNDRCVIGDFGSVVEQGETGSAVSLTKHSLLYRPPELFVANTYYRAGDVYQLGIFYYQMLGGFLPYGERDWLSVKEQIKYDELQGYEQQLFSANAIEKKIKAGRLLDYDSLPAYVPKALVAIIRKATRVVYADRYDTVADFCAALTNARAAIPDWTEIDWPTLRRDNKTIRLVKEKADWVIEKDSGTGWRRDRKNSFTSFRKAVEHAEAI